MRIALIFLAALCCVFFSSFFLFSPSAYAASPTSIIGSLHAGKRPEALAIDTQTHLLVIAYESSGDVVGFDPISGKVRWRTHVVDSLTDIQVDSATHRVYAVGMVYRTRQENLTILDDTTGRILSVLHPGIGDDSIALDSKRRRVYVSTPEQGLLSTFTFPLNGIQPVQTTQLHIGRQPGAIGVNSQLGRLYVADSKERKITVIDEESGKTTATIPVAELPLPPLRVDEATARIYVVSSTGQELTIIDGRTNKVIAHPAVAPYPEGVAFDTATRRIYVANEGNREGSRDRNSGKTLTIIDGNTFEVLGTLAVGLGPDGVEVDPALHRVYVALEESNAVIELSDSPDLPLQSASIIQQTLIAHQTSSLLRQATILTLIMMVLTIVGATLHALSRHWHARGSLQK